MVQASRSDPDDNSSFSPRPAARRPKPGTYASIPQANLTSLMTAKINGAALKVGMAIAQRQWEYRRDGGRAVPLGLDELASMTGSDRSNVVKAVKDLEAAGLLLREKSPGGRNRPSRYALTCAEETVVAQPQFAGDQGGAETVVTQPETVVDSGGNCGGPELSDVTLHPYKQDEALPSEAVRRPDVRLGGTDTRTVQQGENRDCGASDPTAEDFKRHLDKPVASLFCDARLTVIEGGIHALFRYPDHLKLVRKGSNWEAVMEAVLEVFGPDARIELEAAASADAWKVATQRPTPAPESEPVRLRVLLGSQRQGGLRDVTQDIVDREPALAGARGW